MKLKTQKTVECMAVNNTMIISTVEYSNLVYSEVPEVLSTTVFTLQVCHYREKSKECLSIIKIVLHLYTPQKSLGDL